MARGTTRFARRAIGPKNLNETAGRDRLPPRRENATTPALSQALAPSTGASDGLRADHLLALQRTVGNQAVQRLLAQSGPRGPVGGNPPIQRKLSWKHTKWDKASYLDASSGGGGGVLFVGEKGREVVLKPGEEMATESAMVSMLHNKVNKKKSSSLFSRGKSPTFSAAGLRVATPKESQEAKAALEPLLDQVGANAPEVKGTSGKQFKNDRARELVGKLSDPGVVVQDVASGKEFKDAIKGVEKHTDKSEEGDVNMARTSPLQVFTDTRSISALGKSTVVDLFTGNRDRLLMYNPENFMVTPYSITMIDNIWMGTDASYFKTTKMEGRNGEFTITADEALAAWKADPQVQDLAAGKFDAISKMIFDRVADNAARGLTKNDRLAFAAIFAASEANFIETFSKGLAAGKKDLIKSLGDLLKNQASLKKLAPGADLKEIMANVKKRRDFLKGGAG